MSSMFDQDMAGQEFDKWLDWNAAANGLDNNAITFKDKAHAGQPSLYPISPLSTAHSDTTTTSNSRLVTALTGHDLPTPTGSSPSEGRSSTDARLSGDTLREYPLIASKPALKRKLSPYDVPTAEHQNEPLKAPAKKRPHNIVEKRYRANLNDKIAELRDSVPSLRIAKKAKTNDEANISSGEEDLDGLTPGNKLNKASVLTKAVEYIRHLEFRTKRLEDENRSLKERLETLDKVIAQGGSDAQRATAFTSTSVIEDTPSRAQAEREEESDASHRPHNPPQGLIPVPESFRNLRQNACQEHYGHLYDNPPSGSRLGGKWPTRIMLGSLAGLMVMEGFGESDQGTSSKEKGLFGIPLELLDGWKFLRSPRIYLTVFAQYCRAGGVLPLVKGFLTLTIVAFLVFAYLFNSKPAPKEDIEDEAVAPTQLPGLASPIEVRRRAWSTSMQALQLPHHSFFPEWLAVTSEWLKYTIRYLFGSQAYRWITGRTPDDETARIKAWDIAIDAQLAGGDIEISRSRVVLTSFGSGTLPRTPLRLMLKSLHCRVLMWGMGRTRLAAKIANLIGWYFANREWRRARRLHEKLSDRHPDRLPGYLLALLDADCDDVFLDIITQRAYNLMYDRPTNERSEDSLMDVVVEDHAIRSPLDAIAAWRSTCALRKALEIAADSPDAQELIQQHLQIALGFAPPESTVETRALAMHAVMSIEVKSAFYTRAVNAMDHSTVPRLSPQTPRDLQVPFFIDSSTPASARPDIAHTLHCARATLLWEQEDYFTDQTVRELVTSQIEWNNAGPMTVSALHYLLWNMAKRGSSTSSRNHNASSLQLLCARVCELPANALVASSITGSVESLCVDLGLKQQRRRRSNDTGYGSLEDEDEGCAGERMKFRPEWGPQRLQDGLTV